MKKGVSPLIATVLLVGFTIALAALVMTWGQSLFQKTVEQTSELASSQMKCVQEVGIDITKATITNGIIEATVDNTNTETVTSFISRIFYSDDTIDVLTQDKFDMLNKDFSLQPYGRSKAKINYTETKNPTKIELLPVVPIDKGTAVCADRSDTATL